MPIAVQPLDCVVCVSMELTAAQFLSCNLQTILLHGLPQRSEQGTAVPLQLVYDVCKILVGA